MELPDVEQYQVSDTFWDTFWGTFLAFLGARQDAGCIDSAGGMV